MSFTLRALALCLLYRPPPPPLPLSPSPLGSHTPEGIHFIIETSAGRFSPSGFSLPSASRTPLSPPFIARFLRSNGVLNFRGFHTPARKKRFPRVHGAQGDEERRAEMKRGSAALPTNFYSSRTTSRGSAGQTLSLSPSEQLESATRMLDIANEPPRCGRAADTAGIHFLGRVSIAPSFSPTFRRTRRSANHHRDTAINRGA